MLLDDFEPAPWTSLSEPDRDAISSALRSAGYAPDIDLLGNEEAEVVLFELLSPLRSVDDLISEERSIDALRALAARLPEFPSLRAWDDSALDANRTNPIRLAIELGWPKAAAELALLGIDPFDPADAQECPLAAAAKLRGPSEAAAREFFSLLAGLDRNKLLSWRDPHGDALLHLAAAADCPWMLSGLLALGADPEELASFCSTPIDRARDAGSEECLLLLEEARARLRPDGSRESALMLALSKAFSEGRIFLDGIAVSGLLDLEERLIPEPMKLEDPKI